MTFAFYTKRPYIEYVAVSLDEGKHADIDANNVAQIRAGIAREWSGKKDLIQIRRSMTNIPGYVGFDRSKGLYFWVNRDSTCRAFNPNTGVLGKTVALPKRERKLIYDEETWEIGQGYRKNRTIGRL